MAAKLVIDLGRCATQGDSGVECSYKHHPGNRGFDALLEMVRFALVCRRCEAAPCVKACPRSALEKMPSEHNDAGTLFRHNMLCTGCGTCAMACPFGTIYTDLIPFPSSVCDVCAGRLKDGEQPLCVQTDTRDALQYREADASSEPDMVEVFDSIAVKVPGGTTWEPLLREHEKAER